MFQTPLTIKQIIGEINKIYYLPSIQREFVWSEKQIINLFDSILTGYPIGSFLFWRVNKDNIKNFEFYEFLKEFHQIKNRHNKKANLNGVNEIQAILDGQQRITSLFIGLKGTFAVKKPYFQWNNPNAYPIKKLYINLKSSKSIDELEVETETQYELAFLENVDNTNKHWFEVGKILDMDLSDILDYISKNNLDKNANKILPKLYEAICSKPLINYYLETSNELHQVLNVFIRVNSGGSILSYSDLLLSIATASWKNIDAREQIHQFVDEINNMNFSINKDFVLKTSLLLLNKDVKFKIDNFNSSTMTEIETNWEKIKNSIRMAFLFLKNEGYNLNTLTSNYPVAIISLYFFVKNFEFNKFLYLSEFNQLKGQLKKFVIKTSFKQTFSSSLDTVLSTLRSIIISPNYNFDLTSINQILPINKKLDFNDADIDSILSLEYEDKQTFMILSLLYPNLNLMNYFHVDHIYPYAKFSTKSLKNMNFSNDEIEDFQYSANCLANLQLLEGNQNINKRDKMPQDWLNEIYSNENEKIIDYKNKNYINPMIDLTLDNFKYYYEDRKTKIKNELLKIL